MHKQLAIEIAPSLLSTNTDTDTHRHKDRDKDKYSVWLVRAGLVHGQLSPAAGRPAQAHCHRHRPSPKLDLSKFFFSRYHLEDQLGMVMQCNADDILGADWAG